MVVWFDINIEGLDDLQEAFWPDVMEEFLDMSIKKSILILEWESKKEAPVDRGRLRSAFLTKFSPLKGVLYNTTSYALNVLLGTWIYWPRGQEIKAKPWKVFVFNSSKYWLVFTKTIKGQRPNDFLWRAIDKSWTKIDRVLWQTANFLIAKLNK